MKRTNEQLKQIALDIHKNLIFSTGHMEAHELQHVGTVFMPLALGATEKRSPESIGMIFEYYSKAGPRSINGMPIFMSCQFVHKDDMKVLEGYIAEFRKAEEAVK